MPRDDDDPDAPTSSLSEEGLIARARDYRRRSKDHWSDFNDEFVENNDFVAGRQWLAEDETALREEGRVPITFNRTSPVVEAVAGSQVNNRQEVRFLPRGNDDDRAAEVASLLADWARQQCEAEDEESEAFFDAVVGGMGWIETRLDYDEDHEGRIIIERVDPLEMYADPSARKKNLADQKEVARCRPWALADIKATWPGAKDALTAATMKDGAGLPKWHNRRDRYDKGGASTSDDESRGDDRVEVIEYQWAERQPGRLVADPVAGQRVFLTSAEWTKVRGRLREAGQVEPESMAHHRMVWQRAFLCGDVLLERGPSPCPFGPTFQCITGKRDRNKGTWYGLVRTMKDPQRWSNKFFSQILHIINTSAKSGVWAEESVTDDWRDFERTMAKPGGVTKLTQGGLAGIKEKQAGNYPQGLDRLMQISISATQDVSGVNKELLGLADRDQPGVLEAQRKQAAQAILAPLFDALRRYYKRQGRVLLHFIRSFVPPDKMIRVIGKDNQAQFLQSAMLADALDYDLIVDEAPSSPNAKAATWAALQPMLPIIAKQNPPLDAWLWLFQQSPVPASAVQELADILKGAQQQAAQQPPPPDPAMVKAKADVEATQAKTAAGIQGAQVKAQSDAEIARFKAQSEVEIARAKASADVQLRREQAASDQLSEYFQRTVPGAVQLQ